MTKNQSTYIEQKVSSVIEQDKKALEKVLKIKKFAMIRQILTIKKNNEEMRNLKLKDLRIEISNCLEEDF